MTDTPTPQMTPEQRADLVTHYTRGKWFIWNGGADCPVPLGTRLEIVGGFDDTWTTVAEEGSIFWPNVAAFRIDPPTSKLTAECDAAQAEIARLTAALATAREDGMREAMQCCQAVANEAKSYNIPQMTMGANTCRDAILDAIKKGAAT